MQLRGARLVAFAVLLGLAAPAVLGDVVQSWIQAGRRRAARTEVDEHPELTSVSAEPAHSQNQDVPALAPFLEVDAFVLTPPVSALIERPAVRFERFVRSDRRRPSARAPPPAA